MVELREITKDNFEDVLELKVSGFQEDFVLFTAYFWAQAWVYKYTAFPFAIYVDKELVGYGRDEIYLLDIIVREGYK